MSWTDCVHVIRYELWSKYGTWGGSSHIQAPYLYGSSWEKKDVLSEPYDQMGGCWMNVSDSAFYTVDNKYIQPL